MRNALLPKLSANHGRLFLVFPTHAIFTKRWRGTSLSLGSLPERRGPTAGLRKSQ